MSREAKESGEFVNTYIDERVAVLIPEFEALVSFKPRDRERGKNDLKGWKSLAVREAALLREKYPDDSAVEERTYNTALRQVTSLKKYLRQAAKSQLKDAANHYPVMTIINHFGEALSFLFSEYKTKQNEKYRQRVEVRSSDEKRITLDMSNYIEKAFKVLTIAANDGINLTDVDWRDVSCALALVTGRRMAEIHLSATFRQVDSHEVIFTGQLKGKSRKIDGENLRDVEFRIPTLVPAELVVKSLEWLESNGKRLDRSDDAERVNKRWGKVLSEKIKESWMVVPDEVWQAVDPKDKMTYHKLRGAYFVAVMGSMQGTFSSMKRKAPEILGDKDLTAIEPYERFDIAPGSITKL